MFTPRPLVLTPPEFLAGGADDDLAVVGDEVREVGFDPVEAGAADDGVGFEREFGGPGPKRAMAMTSLPRPPEKRTSSGLSRMRSLPSSPKSASAPGLPPKRSSPGPP